MKRTKHETSQLLYHVLCVLRRPLPEISTKHFLRKVYSLIFSLRTRNFSLSFSFFRNRPKSSVPVDMQMPIRKRHFLSLVSDVLLSSTKASRRASAFGKLPAQNAFAKEPRSFKNFISNEAVLLVAAKCFRAARRDFHDHTGCCGGSARSMLCRPERQAWSAPH